MWPVIPSRITLRVCADLGWSLTAWCPRCGIGATLHAKQMGSAKLSDVPIGKLFAEGKIKCHKVQYGCNGTPASRITVDCMAGGVEKQVAEWGKPSGHIQSSGR